MESEDVDGVEVKAIAIRGETPLPVLVEHVKESETERAVSKGLKLARGEIEGRESGGRGGRKNVDAAMNGEQKVGVVDEAMHAVTRRVGNCLLSVHIYDRSKLGVVANDVEQGSGRSLGLPHELLTPVVVSFNVITVLGKKGRSGTKMRIVGKKRS